MSSTRKTAIVTGASQGIGAGIVKALVERGFNVVANSRKVTQSTEVASSDHVALVDGNIGEPATAARVVEAALSRFHPARPSSAKQCDRTSNRKRCRRRRPRRSR